MNGGGDQENLSVIHPSAQIDPGATIGQSVIVWAWTHVRSQAEIGDFSTIGEHVYVDNGVKVGSRCKIQNGALLYGDAVLGDGVFIGPLAILTNDKNPRATADCMDLKSSTDWVKASVRVGSWATIGAGAICVAPVSIGQFAMVAAGSIVVRDVPNHALVAGNPARQVGWVSRGGFRLVEKDGVYVSPQNGQKFSVAANGDLRELE